MKSIVITVAQLRKLNACDSEVRDFEALFGSEVVVTPELLRTHGSSFSIEWAVDKGVFDSLALPKHSDSYNGDGCPLCRAIDEAGGTVPLVMAHLIKSA
jgi:hypothetical protein